ncbi:MAG: DUF5675 family protein [Bacteroidota bacterium]|nr:DUF5675 family protein [Bacteroidota bacterium]
MYLVLTRSYHVEGTNGIFSIEGLQLCSSIELPNRDNQKKVSCIPEGMYPISLVNHSKLGECIKIDNVPHRKGIYIHAMNDANHQSKGCIGAVKNILGIAKGIHSKAALKALVQRLKDTKIQQIIIQSDENEHSRTGISPNPKIL